MSNTDPRKLEPTTAKLNDLQPEFQSDQLSAMSRRFSAINIGGDKVNLQPSNIITTNEIHTGAVLMPPPTYSPVVEISDAPDECNLFVGDLARGLSEEELQSAFSKFGRVMTVNIKRDRNTGKNLGYGFVKMGSHEEAIRAKECMQKVEIRGRKLRVGWAQKNTSLFVGGFLENITVEQLNAFFRPYGELDEESSSILQSGRCGIVRFKNRIHAENARRQLNGMQGLGSPTLKVDWNNTQTNGNIVPKSLNQRYGKELVFPSGFCIHVILENPKGIRLDRVEDTIHDLFIEYSPLADVVIIKDEGRREGAPRVFRGEASEDGGDSVQSSADAGAGSKDNHSDSFDLAGESNAHASEDIVMERVHCSVRFAATPMGHTKAINSLSALNGVITVFGDKVTCLPPKNDFRINPGRPFAYPRIPIDMSAVQMQIATQYSGTMWRPPMNNQLSQMRDSQRAPFDGVMPEDVRKPGQIMENQPPLRSPNWPPNGNVFVRPAMSPYMGYPYNVPIPSSPSMAYSDGEMGGYYPIPISYPHTNLNETMMQIPNSPSMFHPGATYMNGYYNSYGMGYPHPKTQAYINQNNYMMHCRPAPEAPKYMGNNEQAEN